MDLPVSSENRESGLDAMAVSTFKNIFIFWSKKNWEK